MSKLSHEIENLLKHVADRIVEICERGHHHHKPRIMRLLVIVRPLEPKKEIKQMTPIELGQIPLGQRIPVSFIPDEAVDLKADGNFASVTVTSGDATAQIAPGSTSKSWTAFFNGDGAIGLKSATVAADGHVGEGDVEIEQVVNWEVTSVDATSFTNTVGPLEPIPTVPVGAAKK